MNEIGNLFSTSQLLSLEIEIIKASKQSKQNFFAKKNSIQFKIIHTDLLTLRLNELNTLFWECELYYNRRL